jgi:tetratricopeptide (TPR) repeat protein
LTPAGVDGRHEAFAPGTNEENGSAHTNIKPESRPEKLNKPISDPSKGVSSGLADFSLGSIMPTVSIADLIGSNQEGVETYTHTPESKESSTEIPESKATKAPHQKKLPISEHEEEAYLKAFPEITPRTEDQSNYLSDEVTANHEPVKAKSEFTKAKNQRSDNETAPESIDESVIQPLSSEAPTTNSTESEGNESGPSHAAYEEFLRDNHETLDMLAVSGEPDKPEIPASPELQEPNSKIDNSGEFQIEMDTRNAHVWNELGNVYFNNSAFDDAIVAYSKAIELDRWFAWPYSNLALAYVQKSRLAEAILLYQRSIELFTSDKDKAISWNRLGNVYRRLNDYDHAINAYQRADELDPDNATLSLQSRFSLLGNYSMEQKAAYAT